MNQSLTSLVNDVYTLTNRPDLVGETLLAVRNATLKAHQSDFFYKDIFETGVVFGFATAQQSLDYKTLVPRWRALKYLRIYTPDSIGGGTPGDFLDVLTPDELLDSYGYNRNNVCYVAGAEIKIRAAAAQQYFLLGCYVNPDVTPNLFKSWIAAEQPAAIIYEAVCTVFKTIGYDEQANAYRQLALEELKNLKSNNILAVGY